MLPSSPSSLCFDKDVFMKSNFNVEKFILDCRRNAGLDTLKDDLKLYLRVLQNAMVELINKDYADFVNLSSNLVGLDKAINNIMHPLNLLGHQVEKVQNEVVGRLRQVDAKLERRAALERRRTTLFRLRSIVNSVEKMEELLGLSRESTGTPAGELTVERVAAQFNKLQFHVNRTRGHPLVERIKPRIAAITGTLQQTLETAFSIGLENGDPGIIRQCLRTYALIDKPREAENLFRHLVVAPTVQELMTDNALESKETLELLYNNVITSIEQCLKQLSEATKGSEEAKGYSFLVNAVWPEIVAALEARLPGLYAPGNPDLFHQRYTLSMEFLSKIESMCGSKAGVQLLRAHPSYNSFLTKWSLPVYFQIRFQEIAGGLEGALEEGEKHAKDKKPGEESLITHASVILWRSLYKCWDEQVFLNALTHRFWKLSCQLVSRYTNWVSAKLTNADLQLAVALITDAQLVAQKLSEWFDECVAPHVVKLCANVDILRDGLSDSQKSLVSERDNVSKLVVQTVNAQCASHLRSISDLPRLYRRTNRDTPTSASTYVGQLLRPVQNLTQEHTLLPDDKAEWIPAVLAEVIKSFHTNASDVLTSIKKIEESLRRLKKNKAGGGGTEKGGVTDDDKIRQQLVLDVTELGRLMEAENLVTKATDVDGYTELLELVTTAAQGETS